MYPHEISQNFVYLLTCITNHCCQLFSAIIFPKTNVLHFLTFRFDATGLRRTKVILQVIMGRKVFHNSIPTIRIQALCNGVGLKKINSF